MHFSRKRLPPDAVTVLRLLYAVFTSPTPVINLADTAAAMESSPWQRCTTCAVIVTIRWKQSYAQRFWPHDMSDVRCHGGHSMAFVGVRSGTMHPCFQQITAVRMRRHTRTIRSLTVLWAHEYLQETVLLANVNYSVARPSVGNARASYSGGCNFRQYFHGIWYNGHPLTSTKNFTEIVPAQRNPSVGVVKHNRGSQV